jgi:hypothetical protein
MPWRGPEAPGEFPTLGYLVADYIESSCAIPDGVHAGEPFLLTDEQLRFVLWHYRLRPDAVAILERPSQPFVYRRSQLMRPQKWGKGPLSAAIICAEADGPALFAGWDANGDPVGRPWPTPLIQVTAVSEPQTANVFRVLLPMIERGPIAADIPDTGTTRINLRAGGRIEPVTASARSRLGQQITFALQDQTESWLKTNGGIALADNQRRNLAGMGGRSIETPNAFDPTESSVAQLTQEAARDDVFIDYRPPPKASIHNKRERRKVLAFSYGDSCRTPRDRRWIGWVDLDRIDADAEELIQRGDPGQAERWFLNRILPGADAAFDPDEWAERAIRGRKIKPGRFITLGFDGSRRQDSTGIVATDIETGHQMVVAVWERPSGAEMTGKCPRARSTRRWSPRSRPGRCGVCTPTRPGGNRRSTNGRGAGATSVWSRGGPTGAGPWRWPFGPSGPRSAPARSPTTATRPTPRTSPTPGASTIRAWSTTTALSCGRSPRSARARPTRSTSTWPAACPGRRAATPSPPAPSPGVARSLGSEEERRMPELVVGSPLWWLDNLQKKLQKRRSEIAVYDDYYEGRHPLAFASEKFLKAFGGLFEAFADNWCDLVVDAVEERLNVTGFRLEADSRGDDAAWAMWQANNLDADSQMGITEALVNGLAAAIVWAGPNDTTPSITMEHPREVIVASAPGNRRRRLAALKWWTDEDQGVEMATVYLPDAIYKYRTRTKAERRGMGAGQNAGSAKWVERDTPGEDWPLKNPLGVVPVVPLANRPRLLVPGVSEIKRVIPLQDAVNKLVTDMVVASEFSAFRQRWATGMDIPVDPETNQPIEPFRAAVDRLFMAEDAQTQFGEFGETNLANFVTAIEMVVQHIASQTRTPPHYFYLRGQFPSGESIKSAETGLVAKARRKMRHLGEDLEEVIRLGFKVLDDPRADQPGLETIWADPESRTEAEHVDATAKKRALKVPLLQLWEDIGYSPQQIDRFKQMHAEEAALGLVDNDPDPAIAINA